MPASWSHRTRCHGRRSLTRPHLTAIAREARLARLRVARDTASRNPTVEDDSDFRAPGSAPPGACASRSPGRRRGDAIAALRELAERLVALGRGDRIAEAHERRVRPGSERRVQRSGGDRHPRRGTREQPERLPPRMRPRAGLCPRARERAGGSGKGSRCASWSCERRRARLEGSAREVAQGGELALPAGSSAPRWAISRSSRPAAASRSMTSSDPRAPGRVRRARDALPFSPR